MEGGEESRQEGKEGGRKRGSGEESVLSLFRVESLCARVAAGYILWLPELLHLGSRREALPDLHPHEFLVLSLYGIYSVCCVPSLTISTGGYFMMLSQKHLPFYTIYTISPSVQPLQQLLQWAWALGDKVRIVTLNTY